MANVLNYFKNPQGGDNELVIGGTLTVLSNANLNVELGGTLNLETGSEFQLNGTDIYNKLTFLNTITNATSHTVLATGSAAANALLFGRGTTADPVTTSTAGKVFVELRTQSSATTGDSRCLYMRHEITGIAGSGESLRSFTKVSAAAQDVRGGHISLDLATTGSAS